VLETLLVVVQLPACLVCIIILLQALILCGHNLHLEGGGREGAKKGGMNGGRKRESGERGEEKIV
jgi:hypothetical protein